MNDYGAIVGTATYTPSTLPPGQSPPANQPVAGSHGVFLAPILVVQSNYPTTQGVEDLGPTTTQNIIGPGGNGIAYITGAPAMPQLTAQIGGFSSSGMTVDWRLHMTSERPERGTKDDIDIPASSGDGASGGETGENPVGGPGVVDNEPINTPWTIDYPPTPFEFDGGTVTLYFTIKNAAGTALGPEQSVTFKIRGKNPTPSAAYNYIQEEPQGGPLGNLYYAWGIAKHESAQDPNTYCQFNANSPAEEPNYGYPDGWGIFQRDDGGITTPTEGSIYVTTDQVYSWQVNSDVCVQQELAEEWNEANNYLGKQQSRHPTQFAANPPPPYTVSGKTFAPIDVLTMERYNGAGKFYRLLQFSASTGTWTWNLPNAPRDTEPYINRVAERMTSSP